MGNKPTGPRLERITPPPLTFEIWTRPTTDARSHPVEVGIPNMQEAFKRLAAYGGPAYFEIRDSDGNVVYEAARDEEKHHHYYQPRSSADPAPPPLPRKPEFKGVWVIAGLGVLILFLLIIENSQTNGDEPVSAETPNFVVDGADGTEGDASGEAAADSAEETAIRDQLQDQYKANAIKLMQQDDGSQGAYVISDAVNGEMCSGDRIWFFGQPSGTAPMEDGMPLNGRFIYLDMAGGKASRGLYRWNGRSLATKTVVAGSFDPATTSTNDDALWDASSSIYHEVVESWQGLPFMHVDTASNRHTYNRFLIGRKSYMLCRLN